MHHPVAAEPGRSELTVRGVLLGMAITLVFTAANVYLGLKVGLTFASSIPAAVISMAVLRAFRGATVQENNIVQTVASAAGTLSSIIFVLPGLVMVGWWTHFPFWTSFALCAVGGVLGVMYTIPLRRALVTESPLPYPEGVAAAEEGEAGNRQGLAAVVTGTLASAGFAAVTATRLFAGEVTAFWRMGRAATGLSGSFSLALLAAGHLVGLAVGSAMLVGLLLAWGVLTPLLTALQGTPGSPEDAALLVWSKQVRFIGAGTIGIAAIWTLGKLARPVLTGLQGAIAASRRTAVGPRTLPRTERDLPIGIVGTISGLALIPLAFLLVGFLGDTPLAAGTAALTLTGLVYIVVVGFMVAGVCGYMAGLIGSSNSPLSGVGILTVIGAAIVLGAVGRLTANRAETGPALVALALFVTAIVFSVATIANDNLQDLKTGQLVDATPWKQQVALIFGVFAGALVIPPILDLLNQAYGFAGAPRPAGATTGNQPLPAPQATLISALARGTLEGNLNWGLIGTGALIGVVLVAVDEWLRREKRGALPPLAVGIGIYLPMATTAPIVVGATIGHFYDRWAQRQRRSAHAGRLGVLLASGLIVGESLFGVLLAALIVGTNRAAPLAVVGDSFGSAGLALGLVGFAALTAGLYAWTARQAK